MSDNWERVPYRLKELYVKYAGEARQLMADFPEHEDAWVIDTPEVGIIKPAAEAPLQPFADASRVAQTAVGGPNPLTAALLYGTLGAGLGWGGMKLLSKLLPDRVRDDAGLKVGLPLGALIGSGGALALHGWPNVAKEGWGGLLQPSAIQDIANRMPSDEVPKTASVLEKIAAAYPKGLEGVLQTQQHDANTYFMPDADSFAASQMGLNYVENVDIPYWMDTVRADHHMTPKAKAVAMSLPLAAGLAKGSRIVAPIDIAKVALNAGLGAAMGNAIGMVAGPFLRLTPKARSDIQNAGMLAGILKTIGVV